MNSPAVPAVLLAGASVFVAVNIGGGTIPTEHASPSIETNALGLIERHTAAEVTPPPPTLDELSEVVQRTCARCHNDRRRSADLSLEGFAIAEVGEGENREVAEKMIRKLRLGMMPPPEIAKPAGDTMQILVETIEEIVDESYASRPVIVNRPLQRMPRAEYERTIRSLLDLQIDVDAYFPADILSDGFDNISDIQVASGTLVDSYLRAAEAIALLAVGLSNPAPQQISYSVPMSTDQTGHIEGTPYGTRGGLSVVHNFPVDGEYVLRGYFWYNWVGALFGRQGSRENRLEISIDGESVAVLDIDRWMDESDPTGVMVESDPIQVLAGPRTLSAAFVRSGEGPVNDVLSPFGNTLADTEVMSVAGVTTVPHLAQLRIDGPFNITGVSETPSRRAVFSCYPSSSSEERACAREIVTRLGREAYRRPLDDRELEGLLELYDGAADLEGFEGGVSLALQGILSSPHFMYRFEQQPENVPTGEMYRISDYDLATRLASFLWALPPDDVLLSLARDGGLSEPEVLEQQVHRMLADPRAEALSTRFASQWLQLPGLNGFFPDALLFPDWNEQLRESMRRETQLFFASLVRDDRSVLDLLTADYTYLDERLAEHYGIPGVIGRDFRRVQHVDEMRHGILGHGAVLARTSFASRTSPVVRGLWVMSVLLGTEPPPPPPNVPDLEVTPAADEGEGRVFTVKERFQLHRSNPTCNACHQFIDPLGMPLEHFGATGQWRSRDQMNPVSGEETLWNGSVVSNPKQLREELVSGYEVAIVRNFTENLFQYALGRRVQTDDQPIIRGIVRDAEADGYEMSQIILGVVQSDPFQKQMAQELSANNN